MDTLCGLFGKSRQAYYQRSNYNYKEEIKEEILHQLIERERQLMPRLGGRKLLILPNPRLPPELKLGRDKFFDFLRKHNLLAGKKRKRVRTTYSNHWLHKYPNLIKEFTPDGANQLWVSDITYVENKPRLYILEFDYGRLFTQNHRPVGWNNSGGNLHAQCSEYGIKAIAQTNIGINSSLRPGCAVLLWRLREETL